MATWKQRLIREKLETTPGTPEATTAADAIFAREVTIRYLEADYQQRDFVTGKEGAQGEDLRNVHSGIDYQVEAAPPVVAGDPPAYAHLLRTSAMAMADDDGDTVFTPLPPTAAIPSCTAQIRNGALMQVISGVRGGFSFTAETGAKPFFSFTRRGKYAPPIDFVPATHSFTGWPRALDCTPENMFAHTLGGVMLPVRSFNFTDGRQAQPFRYMNLDDASLTPRRFTGRLTVKWPARATKDLLTEIRNGTTQQLVWTLGKTAAVTLMISAPKVQIKFAGEQEVEGDLCINLDLVFEPLVADDEIEIRFPGA